MKLRDSFLPALQANIEMVITGGYESEIIKIDQELEDLQKELLKRVHLKQGYDDIADEIDLLREQKQLVLIENAEQEGVKQRIEEMITFLHEQPGEIVVHDENLVRRLIQRVTVYDEKCTVEFKSGMEVDVEI